MRQFIKQGHTLISAAVESEISSLIDQLHNVKIDYIGTRKVFSGDFEKTRVKILITGPGIINSVQALCASIEKRRPELMIQTGCAGAFRASGLTIGDIAIATKEIDVHLGIEPLEPDKKKSPLPFPILTKNNLEITNTWPFDSNLVDTAFNKIKAGLEKTDIQVKKGPFITVETITATDRRAKNLFRHFSPCMEAMEGCSAAHLSLLYDIPLLEIRAASNYVGKRDKNAWNLPLAFERCAMAVMMVLADNVHFIMNLKS